MIENYKPTYVVEAVYMLRAEMLKRLKKKAILVDLDNTLIAWNNPLGTPELRRWLQEMKEEGIPVLVVSNNKYSRIKKAVEPFGVDFVSRAMKPFTKGYKEALKKLDLRTDEVIMVGDQLMTDICGANKLNIDTVLVQPLIESDAWITKLNRAREKKVMRQLQKRYDMTYQKKI